MAFPNTKTSLLCYAVIATVIASFVLSVDAIKCHQCNSHLEEDCYELRLNTPLRSIDEQYLVECESPDAYCRKVITRVEYTGETRIVRSCGTYLDEPELRESSCTDIDAEGFEELVCTCFHNGCNSAPSALKATSEMVIVGLATSLTVLLAASAFRRSA